jgi:uncharacterized protein (TIGR03067 family)
MEGDGMNLLFAVLFACNDIPKIDFTKTDYNPLEGAWVVCEGMANGKPMPRGCLGEKWPMFFRGGKIARCGGVRVVITGPSTAELHVLPSRTDVVPTVADSGPRLAIFRRTGDTLEMCWAIGKRPTAFASTEVGITYTVFKRQAR